MEFIDYEKKIRECYPYLIDSYVKQYGEKYRKHIEEELANVKYCFYVTPNLILDYYDAKTYDDIIRAIIASFEELDIDTSCISLDENNLIVEDSSLGNLIEIFFPKRDSLKDIKENGIYTFLDCYDNNIDMIKKRIELLKKINYIDANLSYESIISSKDYKIGCMSLKKMLELFDNNIKKYCSTDYSELLEYGRKLEKEEQNLYTEYERKFLKSIKIYLSEHDQDIIAKDGNFSPKDLDDYELYFYFDGNTDMYDFSLGPFDMFNREYDSRLKDNSTSQEDKDYIIDMRLKYLSKLGYDVNSLNREILYDDWHQIPEVSSFLPSDNMFEFIESEKEYYQDLLELDLAKKYIINNQELDEYTLDFEAIYFGMHYFSRSPKDFSKIVVFCPLSDTYNYFDEIIDHELRHLIESSEKTEEDGSTIAKVGMHFSSYNLKTDELIDTKYENFNERVTQLLSTESTKERWKNNIFFFSNPLVLRMKSSLISYDRDLDNTEIIFNSLRDEIIEAQISDDFDLIFKTIPKDILDEIDYLITSHKKDDIKRLHEISDELVSRNNKTKKLGTN